MDFHKATTDNSQSLNLQSPSPAGPLSSAGIYYITLNDNSVDHPKVILLKGNQNFVSLIPSTLPTPSQQPVIGSILPTPCQQNMIVAHEPQAPLIACVKKEASDLTQNEHQKVKIIQNKLIRKVPKQNRKQKLSKTGVKSSILLDDYGVIKKLTHSDANMLILEASAAKEPIFLKKRDFKCVAYIDVRDKDKSNWLGFLPLGDSKTANVWLYEVSGELYGVTAEEISVGTPLAIGYSKQYFEEHELPDSLPVLCLDSQPSKSPLETWKCPQCSVTLKSSTAMNIHVKNHAKRKYLRIKSRCPYCKRVYSSKNTLKRHIQLKQCVMMKSDTNSKPSTSETLQKTATGTPISRSLCHTPVNEEHMNQKLRGTPLNRSLCPTPINEETRLPSDESLQNYTNGLDISTNLFDPNLMPNLDTSVGELNPYSLLPLGYKEGNEMAAAAEYARFSRELMNNMDVCNDDEVSKVKEENTDEDSSIICSHCKESVLKSKHKQHYRKCIAKGIKCTCGKLFFKMETYRRHWQEKHKDHKNIEHNTDPYPETQKLKSHNETEQKPLICDECNAVFKRRGMLVNHMWTKHKKKSSVPLEKRIKLYPCLICPVVYRTAAKRKRHSLTYHPGIEIEMGKYVVETERRVVAPATCPVCPREYATQAKLNQHIRAAHPGTQHEINKNIQVIQLAESKEVQFTQNLTEPLSIGSHIVCTGTPSDDIPWFALNIGCGVAEIGKADIAVHFNVRLPQCYVVRNSRRHDKWGTEETTSFRPFPFKVGQTFTIEILIDEKATLWAVDGHHFCTYEHRNPSSFNASWVQITGLRDATLTIQKAEVYPGLAPNVPVVPVRGSIDEVAQNEPVWKHNAVAALTTGIPEGHQIVVHGRLRPLLHSFTIDLMDQAHEWPYPNILAHVNVRAYDESHKDRQLVVLNAWLGAWGPERRQRTAKLIPGTMTTFKIVRGPEEWCIYADGVLIGELEHRASANGVKAVRVRGDLYPDEIYLCPATSSPVAETTAHVN